MVLAQENGSDAIVAAPQKDERTGRFLTGNIGGGRPKGSRNRLAELCYSMMHRALEEGGIEFWRTLRDEQPGVFARVVVQVLPRELILKTTILDELSRDEVRDMVRALEHELSEAQPLKLIEGTAAK